jgi:hypothetical protein
MFPQYTLDTVGKLGIMQAKFLAMWARWYIKNFQNVRNVRDKK